ncbi:MAG TPA: CHAT domain-containing protein [Ktedonobacteraceae bacterium]|nr:CHAT domain-containing protein [Ktedonobacteraceae bacterium]
MSQEQSFKPVEQDVSPDDMSKRAGNAYLEEFLLEWIDTPDWSTSMKYVQACPELLTDAAEQILTRLSQLQRDEQIQEILTMHAHLLQSARLHGVEDAYAALLPQQKPEHTLSEEMKTQAQVFVWLRISDWAEAHAYLQTHPRLLTDLAAQHLDQIRFVQTEASERKLISQRQALLRTARRWDIAEVSSYFHLAEQVEEPGSLEQQALLSQLQAWIATHSWEESQIYLDAHPDLVSPVAESLLAALWVNQQEDTMLRVLLAQRLQLLQRVRAQGSVDAYRIPPTFASLNEVGIASAQQYQISGRDEDLLKAPDCWQKALMLVLPYASERAVLLNNLGNGLFTRFESMGMLENLEAAITAFSQSLELTPFDSERRAFPLNGLSAALRVRYERTGHLADLEAAVASSTQAVEIASSTSPELSKYLNNLGSALRRRYEYNGKLEDLEAAITAFQQALERTPADAPERSRKLTNLGNGFITRYNRVGKLEDLEAAVVTLKTDWLLPASRFAALPVTYQLGHQQQQERRIAFLVTAYLERATQHQQDAATDRRAALEVVEGSKSRLLTQLVGRGTVGLPAGVPSVVATWERHLLAGLTELDSRDLATHDQMSAPEHTPERQHRLQQRQNMLQELEMLWGRIATVGSEGAAYVALRRGEAPQWQDLALLAENLGDRTALLSLYLTRERTIFFFLRAGWEVPRVIEAPLGQVAWSNLTERTFREVHRYQPGVRRGETWGHDLQPWLEAARPDLKGVERLVLAPAGNGHLLPWGVLAERAGWTTPNGSPLPVITVPALGVVPRLRQRLHVTTGPALVVGNPTGDLPDAAEEARHVAARFATSPLIGAAATKKAIVPRLAEALLIHLAAHAFFNVQNPLDAGIVLADGVLTAREVLDYRLQADLLVLSACESGQTGSLGGEELAGLSQAFLQAGVRSLLVSLWRVNDTATAALMQSFYRAWQTGTDKALALRQAMTQIQQDPRWGHPHYWGAFILVGDWD